MTAANARSVDEFEDKVVAFYMSVKHEDDPDKLTCDKFKIDEDTLNHIMMRDFVESHP